MRKAEGSLWIYRQHIFSLSPFLPLSFSLSLSPCLFYTQARLLARTTRDLKIIISFLFFCLLLILIVLNPFFAKASPPSHHFLLHSEILPIFWLR